MDYNKLNEILTEFEQNGLPHLSLQTIIKMVDICN